MSTVKAPSKVTHAEFIATLIERFGEHPSKWAFVCPSCGDVATGDDFREALIEHPRIRRDGTTTEAAHILGQECIGRTLGALSVSDDEWTGRGCTWVAYGLFRGPLFVELDGHEVPSFHIAEVSA